MTGDGLKLSTYFGERDRVGGAFAADALAAIYGRHSLGAAVLMRGVEGFGAKHPRRTDRLLTLSEDLPMVSVAVDCASRVESALPEVQRLRLSGLMTVERCRLMGAGDAQPPQLGGDAKLTVFLGRRDRANGQAAHRAVVALLHRLGVAGATVLLGVDGTTAGVRRRAAFFSANSDVPLMVVAVGGGNDIAKATQELAALPGRPLATLERVRVCKRDGLLLSAPHELPATDPTGRAIWQKLTIYAGEQSRHDGRPLSGQVVRRLRRAGAPGATSLRGIWGYHGDHRPHGDSLWQLRRRVPVVTVVIDAPHRTLDWFTIIDELTDEAGLVTSELVPAVGTAGTERFLRYSDVASGWDDAA